MLGSGTNRLDLLLHVSFGLLAPCVREGAPNPLRNRHMLRMSGALNRTICKMTCSRLVIP